jgi:hypothetical protein
MTPPKGGGENAVTVLTKSLGMELFRGVCPFT